MNHQTSTVDLFRLCATALGDSAAYAEAIKANVRALVSRDGKEDRALMDVHQVAVDGVAWVETYTEALRQMLAWAQRLEDAGQCGALERLMLGAAFGEYLNQLMGGIPMSQGEMVRPHDLGIEDIDRFFQSSATATLRATGNTAQVRQSIADHLAKGNFGASGLADDSMVMVSDQFHRFANDAVIPHAHEWHLQDQLIPLPLVEQMAELGVFGLTIPEADGGLGMGKLAMCIVSEELSRGYIGVGSLGTRSEIAAELIQLGGTPAQRATYLPAIASGAILPTAVFTEPNTGSDLGSLRTRAERTSNAKGEPVFKIYGAKTWITHAARTDLMTLLVRTDPHAAGYRGLSMLLAEKPRGTDANPFPAEGMSGGEIHVLGYRGMKEYEIGFDGFEVPVANLLGGEEGQGFKQLMRTFESARIQTAARAIGVAQCAMELGLAYALERIQFGQPIMAFPRVSGKLAWMAVETMLARQLTYFAAGEKDKDKRCDIEAGMAKLLAARVAWANADNALQVHGGNGYALEYPISRVLCDARILNIFEGAAEIQAKIIARGLMGRQN